MSAVSKVVSCSGVPTVVVIVSKVLKYSILSVCLKVVVIEIRKDYN